MNTRKVILRTLIMAPGSLLYPFYTAVFSGAGHGIQIFRSLDSVVHGQTVIVSIYSAL
ncbi:MAG: hypothetical protein ICV53_06705 [Flavisolibacter sp.]|nr:hypothetical protein [Flavisolibacter sp.]MBD0365780.1 hypothetical protein [Flavisolibacter sp.]